MEFNGGVKCYNCAEGKYTDDQEPINCNAYCCSGDTRARLKARTMEFNGGVKCQNCVDGKYTDDREPIICNADCCGGDNRTRFKDKNVSFSNEIKKTANCSQNRYELINLQNVKDSGVCVCCREGECADQSKEVGMSMLVYELPEPKFDDLTINKKDFGPKPLPNRELPPWHPILKNQWRPLEVPSSRKTTYQHDYTPPIILPHQRKKKQSIDECIYLTEDDKTVRHDKGKMLERYSSYEQPESFQVWRKTTDGPSEVIEVCDKPHRPIPVKEVHSRPTEPSVCHAKEKTVLREQLHGPECEKHCYSTPLMCHIKQEPEGMGGPTSANATLAAITIEKNHLHHGGKRVHFSPDICHVKPMTNDEKSCESVSNICESKAHFQTEKHKTYDRGSDDFKNAPCNQRINSTTHLPTNSYIGNRQEYSTGMDKGKSLAFDHQEKHYSSPKCESGCSMNSQLHGSDYGNCCFEEYPLHPEKYHTDKGYSHSRNNNSDYPKSNQNYNPDDCDCGLKRTPAIREASHNVRFKEEMPNYGQLYSENNTIYNQDHGLVQGPSLLGHYPGEGCNVLPVCAAACNSVGFGEDERNSSRVYLKDQQVSRHGISDHSHENKDFSVHGSGKEKSCTHSNEFNICEDTKCPPSRWWKAGSSNHGKGKGSLDGKEDPQQFTKHYSPPTARQDFKQPTARGDYNNDCGCTAKEEKYDFPKFETGGLI